MPNSTEYTPAQYYRRRLEWFIDLMVARLVANDHKGHEWVRDDPISLLNRTEGEIGEVVEAMEQGVIQDVASECADVANMIFMTAEAHSYYRIGKQLDGLRPENPI